MMNPWPVARAALRRRRGSAAALALLVAVAVALGVAVGTVERGLREGSVRAVAGFDLVIGAPGSPTSLLLAAVFLRPEAIPLLPGAALARLAEEPGIAWSSPIAFGDSWRGHPIVGVGEPFLTRGGRRALAAGRAFAGPWEAVLGAAVPLDLGDEFTPGHGRHADADADGHGHEHSHYEVVGRLPPQGNAWDRAILVPIDSVWELHGLGNGHGEAEDRIGAPWTDPPGVPAVVVAPRGVGDAYRLRAVWRNDSSLAVFPAEVLVPLLRALGDARGLLQGMAWAGVALVMATLFIALAAGFASRRREVAVLRALGASPGFVAGAAWLEAAVILGVGVATGLPLGWLAAGAIGQAAGGDVPFAVQPGPAWEDALVPLAALAAGWLAAVLPALVAGRREVERDLRG